MTALVTYATQSGATRTLAETLAGALRESGTDCDLVDIEDAPDPVGHDAVVLGSAVRNESIERSAASWARRHAEVLASRPFGYFSGSGSASDPAEGGTRKATDAFLATLAHTPVATANLPGWVLMDRIPLHERLLQTSMRTPTGDFRDLPAVAARGREIAPLLRG